jgi:hypothetical protein
MDVREEFTFKMIVRDGIKKTESHCRHCEQRVQTAQVVNVTHLKQHLILCNACPAALRGVASEVTKKKSWTWRKVAWAMKRASDATQAAAKSVAAPVSERPPTNVTDAAAVTAATAATAVTSAIATSESESDWQPATVTWNGKPAKGLVMRLPDSMPVMYHVRWKQGRYGFYESSEAVCEADVTF